MMETWIILAIVAVLGVLSIVFFIRSVIGLFQRRWATAVFRLMCAAAFLVLAGMILPMLARPTPHHSKRTRCMSNLSQISKACMMYAMDHEESFPPSLLSLTNYVSVPKLFVCPCSGNKPDPIESVDQWADYVLVTNLTAGSDSDLVLAYCKPGNHVNRNGANVLLVDGSVTWVKTEDFGMIPCDMASHSRISRKPQQPSAGDVLKAAPEE